MSDTQSEDHSSAGALLVPASPPRERARGAGWRHPAVIVAVIALALLGWQWLETRSRLSGLYEELAHRLAEGDSVAKESRGIARQSQESVEALHAKLGALESRLDQSQGQQAALESMYEEVTRTRDERVLAEVDHAINIAAQQLQLGGNVPGALIALQSADAQLARTDRPQFLPLRKALARDIDRLKAVAVPDLSGMALKLENVISVVDALPLAFEEKPRATAPAIEPPATPQATIGGLAGDVWRELKGLVRVARLDRPDPALLAPENAFFLRENLKLRLLNARLALLQRDALTFADDVQQAHGWIERHFDQRAKAVQNSLATLRQLSGSGITLDLPALSETTSALAATRVGPERTSERSAIKPATKAKP
ncbi:MAG: uroporphyrinogen-III C-methyltransferase [Sterolibacteriaceae bacterium]|nr:uroporphyrinogen-III C-methyltransferase [Sterolibacteriaceae bacterium]